MHNYLCQWSNSFLCSCCSTYTLYLSDSSSLLKPSHTEQGIQSKMLTENDLS